MWQTLLSLPSYIPSPSQGVWYLGFIPIRAYGIAILIGILVCAWWTQRRYQRRGGDPEVIYDLTLWIVPLGILGGRLYHVITSWQLYFGPLGDPGNIWKIWRGGLGIWGAVAVGVVVGCWQMRRRGLAIAPLADAIAPPLLVAQAIGRLGNYFNQELFGAPTTLPWGLIIDPQNRPPAYASIATYHPTFLYEMIWNLMIMGLLLWWQKTGQRSGGELFGLYICGYTLGRGWIESLRIDEANHILGIRLNVWTSIFVFLLGLFVWWWCRRGDFPLLATAGTGEVVPSVNSSDLNCQDNDGMNSQELPSGAETENGSAKVIPNATVQNERND